MTELILIVTILLLVVVAGQRGLPGPSPSLSAAPTAMPVFRPTIVPTEAPTSAVFTASTGRISYTLTTVSDKATWFIRPISPTNYIQIIIENINVQQAELRMFDSSQQGSGRTILNCVQCGFSIPPPLMSSTGTVTISIQGISGVSFSPSSFTLYYIAIPMDLSSLPTQISINLNMGYSSIVPYVVNNSIPMKANQLWYIRPIGATSITFVFDSFMFSTDCSDRLVVYDGLSPVNSNIIFTGCRSSDLPKKWFYAPSGTALVSFTTSSARVSKSMFNLKYYTNTPWYSCGSLSWPEIYYGESLLIMDGSGPNLMRRGDSCSWRLIPTVASTVTLIMSEVSLKFGASLIVYDGVDSTGYELWRGIGATTTIPPIIRSSGNSLFVSYLSDTSDPVRYAGFLGESFANYLGSQGSGRGFSILRMSSEIDVVPPGDNFSVGTTNVNYTWFIKPSIVLGPTITFGLSCLNLSSGTSLYLYDGDPTNRSSSSNLLAVFTGSKEVSRQWYWTSKPSATLVQVSSANTPALPIATKNYFKISYFADGPNYHCGFTRNPARLNMKSWIVTDGSQSTELLYTNQYCEWIIDLSEYADVKGIYIFFTRFHIIRGSLTIYLGDIAKGTVFTTIADTSAIPSPIYLPSPVVGLVYSTESAAFGFGFSLTYYAVTSNSYDSFTGNDLVYIRSSSIVSLQQDPSSSANAVSFTRLDDIGEISANKTWFLYSPSSQSPLYIAPIYLPTLSNCEFLLTFYDGSTRSAPVLARYTNNSLLPKPYKWLVTSDTSLLMTFEARSHQNLPAVEQINFNLAYYSDGPSYHCGFINNPAVLTAPSMVFGDGSGSKSPMKRNENCIWIVEPLLSSFNVAPTVNETQYDEDFMIVLEILECNMVGGSLSVYEGRIDANLNPTSLGNPLWSCTDCQLIPSPLFSSFKAITVIYSSSSGDILGTGFSAVYWTALSTDWRKSKPIGDPMEVSIPLEIPQNFQFSTNLNTLTATKYHLPVQSSSIRLEFFPRYDTKSQVAFQDNFEEKVFDGRPLSSVSLESSTAPVLTCGLMTSKKLSLNQIGLFIKGSPVFYSPSQRQDRFIFSTIQSKTFRTIKGVLKKEDGSTAISTYEDLMKPLSLCSYWLDSGSTQAIRLEITSTTFTNNGRLRIYGGVYGNDSLLFDSNLKHHRNTIHNITIPCGKGFIVSENNATNVSTSAIDFGWSLSFVSIHHDEGDICSNYIASLFPIPQKEDPYVPVYISVGVVVGCGIIFCLAVYLNRLKHKRGYVFFAPNELSSSKYKMITPDHPRHLGNWTAFFNRWTVSHGVCCVCKAENVSVLRLNCQHGICLEDLEGYLNSALGDISMFPVKCPMHYESCTGTIDAKLARRVLPAAQYSRFLEFIDRTTYGDGMRCIFCINFVNFPKDMSHTARVECPYCIQKFCLRCKKPWHVGTRCPLDTYDESLEIWKADSGAQKCPACKKLIEKDGPDTCNHMVHKSVDGIPCVRDRTDFCYLCGEEVTPDYPHNEVRNPGVNHFPDGVFQNCRYVINKEKEAERERLRKQKRMKARQNGMSPAGSSKKGSILPAEGLQWESPATSSLTALISSPTLQRSSASPPTSPSRIVVGTDIEQPEPLLDQFDEEWDLALAQVHSGPLAVRRSTPPTIVESTGGITVSQSSGASPVVTNPLSTGESRRTRQSESPTESGNLSNLSITRSRLASSSATTGNGRRFVRHSRNSLS